MYLSLDEADGEHSPDLCEPDPVLNPTPASGDSEQEVPCGPHKETSMTKKRRGLTFLVRRTESSGIPVRCEKHGNLLMRAKCRFVPQFQICFD